MGKFFICLIIAIILMANRIISSSSEAEVHYALNSIKNELESKYSLRAFEIGLSFYEYRFTESEYCFQSVEKIHINKARPIILSIAEDYLRLINNNSILKKYMTVDRFENSNINFSIYFENETGERRCYPDVSNVKFICNKIYYMSYEEQDEFKPSHDYEETYEEARLKITDSS